jgi:hypothetical protein
LFFDVVAGFAAGHHVAPAVNLIGAFLLSFFDICNIGEPVIFSETVGKV